MIYVDANVLVFASVASGEEGERARDAVDKALQAGAATSVLTLDEVVWTLRKEGREAAIAHGRRLLALPGLTLLPVTRADADKALDLMAASRLDPRDALHAAVALAAGCRSILSTDRAFDKLPGLRRIAP